jgi:hypothetical protein
MAQCSLFYIDVFHVVTFLLDTTIYQATYSTYLALCVGLSGKSQQMKILPFAKCLIANVVGTNVRKRVFSFFIGFIS